MKRSKSPISSDLSEVECYNFDYISDNDMTEIIKWIQLIRRIQHKNIVIIKDIILQDTCLNINFHLPKHGPATNLLLKKVNQFGISCENVLASMMYQICEGLAYLHYNMNIIHRGICSDAIFIDSKGLVKVGRLNNCIQMENGERKSTDFPIKLPHLIPWYSPEFIEQEFYGYSFNSDVYSLGLLLAALFTARMPYYDCEPPLILLKKLSLVDIPNLDVNTERTDASLPMQDFFKLCTIHNPRERPNIETLLSHSWLQDHSHCSKSSWKKVIIE